MDGKKAIKAVVERTERDPKRKRTLKKRAKVKVK